ncbi:hypothetical protein LZ31DRAFT_76383 [Colletotrichum somersetense]|nr:hypothetical protein LZ31DRAFT_76383 [Colletotrichum somersetense]
MDDGGSAGCREEEFDKCTYLPVPGTRPPPPRNVDPQGTRLPSTSPETTPGTKRNEGALSDGAERNHSPLHDVKTTVAYFLLPPLIYLPIPSHETSGRCRHCPFPFPLPVANGWIRRSERGRNKQPRLRAADRGLGWRFPLPTPKGRTGRSRLGGCGAGRGGRGGLIGGRVPGGRVKGFVRLCAD